MVGTQDLPLNESSSIYSADPWSLETVECYDIGYLVKQTAYSRQQSGCFLSNVVREYIEMNRFPVIDFVPRNDKIVFKFPDWIRGDRSANIASSQKWNVTWFWHMWHWRCARGVEQNSIFFSQTAMRAARGVEPVPTCIGKNPIRSRLLATSLMHLSNKPNSVFRYRYVHQLFLETLYQLGLTTLIHRKSWLSERPESWKEDGWLDDISVSIYIPVPCVYRIVSTLNWPGASSPESHTNDRKYFNPRALIRKRLRLM